MSNGNAQANLALVTRMYDCFNRGDLDTIRNEIFAPDLVWNLPGHHPLAGTKNGAGEVLAFFDQLRRANIQVTLDPASDPATGIDTFGDSGGQVQAQERFANAAGAIHAQQPLLGENILHQPADFEQIVKVNGAVQAKFLLLLDDTDAKRVTGSHYLPSCCFSHS